MSALFARRRWLVTALAGLIACVVSFEAWSRWLTVEPLDVPVTLSPAGRVDQDITIRRDCPHSLELLLSNGMGPSKEAEAFVRGARGSAGKGSREADSSVKVPVKWSLVDAAGRVVSSGEEETAGTHAWGSMGFFRPVVTSLRLPHGRYRLSAVLLRDIPEMDGMAARVSFACHNGKRISGWQDRLLFFGSMVEWLVVLPLAALLAAILLALETRHLPRRREREPS